MIFDTAQYTDYISLTAVACNDTRVDNLKIGDSRLCVGLLRNSADIENVRDSAEAETSRGKIREVLNKSDVHTK